MEVTCLSFSSGSFEDLSIKVIKVLRTIGAIVCVITLMVLGIKYMLGSVEARAEYKNIFAPYIIGAILLFSIPSILIIVFEIMQKIGIAPTIPGPGPAPKPIPVPY